MNETIVHKTALSFALFSFVLLSVGSFLNGARVMTSCLRGVEGFIVFGLLAWIVGKRLIARASHLELPPPGHEVETGEHIDQTA